MDSTITSTPRFRVGAAATASFLALLLLLLETHGSAEAERTLPVTSPVLPSTVQPQQSAPGDTVPDFRRGRGDGDGGGRRGNGPGPGFGGPGGGGDQGDGGAGIPDGGGGGTAPAPSTPSTGGTTT